MSLTVEKKQNPDVDVNLLKGINMLYTYTWLFWCTIISLFAWFIITHYFNLIDLFYYDICVYMLFICYVHVNYLYIVIML
jgi:hypothetical protein